ncbi:alpha/beta fold hydrolase [Paenibacillus naphthalenovorans]|uniref:alpha/beta fold hydrolase n=1 Tax=Paenibacillus naphthalenovorans TaxID=162209 RepID=UPI000888129D|nr:alpha/beta fold hydrolase [Paenibacillus naphthalenovorans]SDJ02095.1 2-hydroxymuconate-semialdehyde hydrolase [Paenibacillus naphthalenovorans]
MDIDSVKERQLALSHGTTYYLEAGQGEPLILLHGVGFWTGGDYWLPNMAELSQYFHVYAPDFVGWGKGDRLQVEYSFSYLADFVREFQDALGISSAHVVGHSMGGWVASILGYESPDRVRTLTLISAGGISKRTLSSMTSFKPPVYDDILKHVSETSCGETTKIAETAKRWYERTLLPGALEAYQKILNHMNEPTHRARYNLQRRLPYIKSPALIIWGSEDKINDISMGELMHSLIPHSEMAVVSCGHYGPSEKPREINALIIQFIQKHLESQSNQNSMKII